MSKPSRTILHIDMDSYFASCEQQANPFLRGKPVGVCGKFPAGKHIRTVVAAASVEAKRLGVKTAMSTWEAKIVCPQIILVPGDPAKYLSTTKKFLHIFEQYTPLVEIFSIDEAFLDVTETAPRFDGPLRIASLIKKELRQKVGEWVTCSIGISHNKLLAKLASESEKPDGVATLNPEDVVGFFENTKLEDLCGIGRQILKRLNCLGIKTIRQLGECPGHILVREFKSYGHTLKLMGQGKETSPVLPYWRAEDPKSMGHSYTLPKYIKTFQRAKSVLRYLCEKVARRLRKERFAGRTIHFYLRREDFRGWGRQASLQYPTDDGAKIYKTCLRMYERKLEVGSAEWEMRRDLKVRFSSLSLEPIRAVGVAVSQLSKKCKKPLYLFPEDVHKEKLIEVMDAINNRHGDFTLFRASLLAGKKEVKDVAGYFASEVK